MGVHGYEEFMIAMANPNDANHQQFKTWYGIDFDPTLFDIRSARRIFMMLDHFGRGYPWEGRG
ncbi:MAG: plasmid pRiA4b ORF-3 family protein [Candidatus Kapabacteria bacterium]|nr:plasmid pRiA4b ORF-3 family protein [Candidatus Kapabacteria bacterium]